MSDHWTHHEPGVRELIARAERRALMDAARALRDLGRGCAHEYAEWLETRAASISLNVSAGDGAPGRAPALPIAGSEPTSTSPAETHPRRHP